MSIEDFDENLPQNLDEIHRLLKEDRYLPQSVRKVTALTMMEWCGYEKISG